MRCFLNYNLSSAAILMVAAAGTAAAVIEVGAAAAAATAAVAVIEVVVEAAAAGTARAAIGAAAAVVIEAAAAAAGTAAAAAATATRTLASLRPLPFPVSSNGAISFLVSCLELGGARPEHVVAPGVVSSEAPPARGGFFPCRGPGEEIGWGRPWSARRDASGDKTRT